MFDIGWAELLVVGVVMIVVVGPKELPGMLRTFGRTTAKLRSMAGDFRRQFDDALKEAELDEVKNLAAEARKLDPTASIRKNLDPVRKIGDEIRSGLTSAATPSAKPAAPAPTTDPASDSGSALEAPAAAPAAAQPDAGQPAEASASAAATTAASSPPAPVQAAPVPVPPAPAQPGPVAPAVTVAKPAPKPARAPRKPRAATASAGQAEKADKPVKAARPRKKPGAES